MRAMRSAWRFALGMLLLAGCQNVPGADGRYATPARGGWDNFRAEVPTGARSPDDNFRAEGAPRRADSRSPGM